MCQDTGICKPKDAVIRHCRWVVKHDLPHPQSPKLITMNFIPEGDLYRLIVKSKLPEAERFERWVFDEVLPSIRKYGLYATDELLDEMLESEYGIRLLTEYKEARKKPDS